MFSALSLRAGSLLYPAPEGRKEPCKYKVVILICTLMAIISAIAAILLLVWTASASGQTVETVDKMAELAAKIGGQQPSTHWIIFCAVLALIFCIVVKWLVTDRERNAERSANELQRERDASAEARKQLIQYMGDTYQQNLAIQRDMVKSNTEIREALDRIAPFLEHKKSA